MVLQGIMEIETVAFGYSRKSQDDKESTEVSINNQNESIENTCSSKSWKLIDILSDKDISGSDRNRKSLKTQTDKAIEFKRTNPFKQVYIVVKDSKRFARDSSFFRDTLKNLDVYGVKVFSIMKNSFLDYTDIGDRVMSVVDEQTIIDGIKNAKFTEELKISKGLPCIPSPFGYIYNFKYNSERKKIPIDKTKDMTNWIIDPKKSEIVKNVFNDLINKVNFKQTISFNKIDKGNYYRIIKNLKKGIYSGFISYTKKFKDSNKNIVRIENVIYKGSYETIISLNEFKLISPNFNYG